MMGAGRRVLVLLIITFVYLFIGAVVFSTIESAHEEKIKLDLHNHLEKFVERNPCLNVSELRDVLKEVWYAASVGLEDVQVARWQNETRPSSRWDLANSFFFSATVITTIGYGHLSPATSAGQNFCIAYAYFGLPLMAVLLSEISSKWKQRFVNVGLYLNSRLVNVLKPHKVRRVVITLLLIIPAYFIVIVIPAFVFSYIEGWGFLVAHYYCFISLTTIGLGDYVATQHDYENKVLVWVYKIATSLYLIGGLGIMALVFHGVQTNKKKNSHRSMSELFKTVLRRRRKPWLQVMEEHADMMADGQPVGSGVISSTVAAAAVAAMVNKTNKNEAISREDNHLDFSSEDDNNHSDDENHDGTSLDDWRQPRHYLRQRQKCNIMENPCSNVQESDDDLNPADEDDTPYTFQSVIAHSHASICVDPESEKTDQRGKKINDIDHPKLTRKQSLPQRLDFRNFGATKKGLIRTQSQSPTCSSLGSHHGDFKTESGGATPRMKFWSPFGSFGGEDSGIHAASSQSTVEMESNL